MSTEIAKNLLQIEDFIIHYFFMTSFLRVIVKDIIVLESVHYLPLEKREKLLRGMHLLEVNERILKQWEFFRNIALVNL